MQYMNVQRHIEMLIDNDLLQPVHYEDWIITKEHKVDGSGLAKD